MLYLMLLYAGLASDQWAVRESAERELIHRVAGWPNLYGEPLARWAGGATSPEVAARVRRPCRVWDNWRANSYVPKGLHCWPVCDCYPVAVGIGVDIRDRSAIAPAPGFDVAYRPTDNGPYWHRWRRGTELMARRMIREGVPAEDVDKLLLRMMALEIEAGSDCNAREQVEGWSSRPWAGGYPE